MSNGSRRQRAVVHVRAGADVEEELHPAEQEAAGYAAASRQKSQQFFAEKAKGLDDEMVKVFKDHKVEVVTLTPAEYDEWVKVAQKSSYAEFAKDVPNGKKLIEEALSVK